jgi:hypothetical protein
MTRAVDVSGRGVRVNGRSVGVGVRSTIPDSANLQADWDPSVYNLNDGDTISTDWSEADGRVADATVNGDPVYRDSDINGEPAIDVDGSDYFSTSIDPDTNQPRSVYTVVAWDNTTGGSQGLYATLGPNSSDFAYLGGIRNGSPVVGYGDSVNQSGSQPSGYYIDTVSAGSGSGEVWTDDTSQTTVSYTGQSTVGTTLYIGARNNNGTADWQADCRIARILDYQADHDSQTRQDVWNYLNSIYSVF